jgi:ketosteroid isomerase-like protein
MSQENVESAKRLNEAARRGDLEAASEFVADDAVLTDHASPFGERRVLRGRDELLRYYTEFAQVFDDFTREVDEWVAVGDWVITVGRWKGRGKGSGAVVEGRGANAVRWRDGKAVEWILNLPTKEAALEAVGLSE